MLLSYILTSLLLYFSSYQNTGFLAFPNQINRVNLPITTSGDEDNLEGNADIKPIIKGGKVFTTLTDSFSHTSLIGKPRHFKLGDNFYQFCERFIEYVNINGITWHLNVIFSSLLDDRTHASLKNVTLADEDKHGLQTERWQWCHAC